MYQQNKESYHKRLNLEKHVQDLRNYEYQVPSLQHETHARKDAVFAYVDWLASSQTRNVYSDDKTNLNRLKQSLIPTADLTNVLISMSTESWDKDPSVIREVGMAIYDPALQYDWKCSFIDIHLIVAETVNECHNKNDEINKFQYGTSIVMPKQEIVLFLQSIVDHFFIYRKGMDGVFISHDYFNQLDQIKALGVTLPASFKRVDTNYLQRISMGIKTSNTLETSLKVHRMFGSNIHNAGNVAHYSLLLCMRICDVNYRKDFGLDEVDARDWFDEKSRFEKVKVFNCQLPSPTKRFDYARDALIHVFYNKYIR